MNAPAEIRSATDRFSDFHLAVACHIENIAWLMDKVEHDDPGLYIVQDIIERLESIIEEQDCRELSDIDVAGNR